MVLCIGFNQSNAQPKYKPVFDNLRPVSPTAFQFQKYTEMPVSEYTGVPQVSVPIYTISIDGVNVPLQLTYHAGGIRVSQEASWVGLGWDCSIGSIVQQINDIDDYGTRADGTAFTKMLPDYAFSGIPSTYPYSVACNLTFPSGGSVFQPGPVQPFHGYKIATQYRVPVNGVYDVNRSLLFTADDWDSEPDIFQANFLGHSLNFILDFKTNKFIVLNKKGYKIERLNGNWKVTVPSGEQFYFEEKSTIESNSTTQNYNTLMGETSSGFLPSSNIWMLTKIVTLHQEEIVFNYTRGNQAISFPQFSQRYHKGAELAGSPYVTTYGSFSTQVGQFVSSVGNLSGYTNTISTSKESYIYLSSIYFPNGHISFSLGNRNDLSEAKKLDRVEVSNLTSVIKSFDFNYDYFNASSVNSNGFTYYQSDALASLRLKLNSVVDNTGAKYEFMYNNEPLPKKNSYAQDYWGFYNGKLDNTTLIPNPMQFNRADLGDNGDNHSSRLQYTKAGTLESIIYPTGGKTIFNYSLHEFDNYWVPDFLNNMNTISTGYGLRISDVAFFDEGNKCVSKTAYSYENGKAVLPRDFFRYYRLTKLHDPQGNASQYSPAYYNSIEVHNIGMTEVSSAGFYSSNPFGSLSSVGYTRVTSRQLNQNGEDNGKIVSEYFNNPDFVTSSVSDFSQVNASLPAFKSMIAANNGLLRKQQVYNTSNQVVKEIMNEYMNIQSEMLYGARIFGYSTLNSKLCNPPLTIVYYDQSLIGYYPIFDYESLLSKTTVKEFSNNNALDNYTINTYDELNRLVSSSSTKNNAVERTEINYPVLTSDPNSISNKMFNANRLLDVFGKRTYKDFPNLTSRPLDSYKSIFIQQGSLFLEQKAQLINPFPYDQVKSEILYDQYDGEGNLLQYTTKGITNSFIYDYNNEYLIAEVANAAYANVGYTGFESNGNGNWTFTGTIVTDQTSPFGTKVYDLNTGNITKSGLNASTTYILSYWRKGGSVNVNGNLNVKVGATVNGWTYYEHEFTNATTAILYGWGLVDEIRLYPKGALMTTYTYIPLIGITSKTDSNGNVSFYEYDNTGRLRRIKDKEGNIIKVLDYQYQSNQ